MTLPACLSPHRLTGLLLLALPLLLPCGTAEAAPRDRPARTLWLSPSEMQAFQRWLCPHGGRPMPGRPGRCDGRGGRLATGPGRGGDDGTVYEWFQGLPPARQRQLACPEGTKPVLARGHTDTLRCLPG
ncbi:hypothetical protein RGI145_11250 [Roseomonas gilardii]|uniref:Ig-like domain-containing protein n=1 Tax=Roseomonas gilardii TaxID=257708 RepID=A0A1L7AFN4_9PROT|nr:hypothetical protein [Roseomonas gilardii]APT57595.1 hypothetical protein RGI145_11250 [Roseomonas gilardii]